MAGLTKLFGAAAAETVWSTYAVAYPGATESELCGLIATDKDYRLPALRLAEANRADSFVYAFDYRGRGPYFPNAHHALDLPFWFGTVEDPRFAGFFLGGEATAGELALAGAMQTALGRFLRGQGAGWAPYADPARATMIFGLDPAARNDPAPATRRIWDGLVP
jgi:para-nitrobenzyl esterase